MAKPQKITLTRDVPLDVTNRLRERVKILKAAEREFHLLQAGLQDMVGVLADTLGLDNTWVLNQDGTKFTKEVDKNEENPDKPAT